MTEQAVGMRITLKLYASLSQHLPPDAREGNQLTLDIASGSSILQVVEPYQLPPKLVHLVLVNGVYVPPGERSSPGLLKDGDVLAIWPPVAGG